jgi:hypothetical protein
LHAAIVRFICWSLETANELKGIEIMIRLTSRATAALAMASLVMGLCCSAHAASYYVDGNYAGIDGAAFGSYTAAYKTINAALAAVPAGSSAANPNKVYFAPGICATAGMATVDKLAIRTSWVTRQAASIERIPISSPPSAKKVQEDRGLQNRKPVQRTRG